MKLTFQEIAHFLLAIAALLVVGHGLAAVFKKLRQPPVIGEILGGILLGPGVFGVIAPVLFFHVFPTKEDSPSTDHILAAVYQMGLLLLMFCSGLEIRSSFAKDERRTAAFITLTGTVIPFLLGMAALEVYDPSSQLGEAQNRTAFLMVFAIAVAVTSIPVISRIFMDLGIVETPFARIVLTAAVVEDIILYVVLAIALSMVGGRQEDAWGLPRVLGLHGESTFSLVYHVGINLGFFAVAVLAGPRLFRWADAFRFNVLKRASHVGFLLLFLITMTCIALYLGITPMFGAFVAGLVAATTVGERSAHKETIRSFSFALFVPVFFAIVGWRIDIARDFEPLFFFGFFLFACVVKAASVYLGARAARESRAGALNIAVAMNARGGPGIVLASQAYDARIIGSSFYTTLVLLAVLTSMLAGIWLDRVKRSGRPLR